MMSKSTSGWKAYLFAGSVDTAVCLSIDDIWTSSHSSKYRQSDNGRIKKEKYFENARIIIKDRGTRTLYQSYHDLPEDIKKMIPPPPPKPPKAPGENQGQNNVPAFSTSTTLQFDVNRGTLKVIGEDDFLPPPPPPPPPSIAAPPSPPVEIGSPPPPPPPPSDMDMAIHMAKNGGTFILNGKKVSSDEAIEALKHTDKISNVQIRGNFGKDVMKIYTK